MNPKDLEYLSNLVDSISLNDVLSSLAAVFINKADECSDLELKDQAKLMSARALILQDASRKIANL